MSGNSYEVKDHAGRITIGLTGGEIRQRVALGLIDSSAQIRASGHRTWHPINTVPGLEFRPGTHAAAPPPTSPPASPPTPDLTPPAASLSDDPELQAMLEVHEAHEAPEVPATLLPLQPPSEPFDWDADVIEEHPHDPTPEPIPEDQPELESTPTPSNTGVPMSSQFMSVARRSLAILIGGYVAKHALTFSANMIEPDSKATAALNALPGPLAAVVAAYAGYLLVCGALDEYGQGDAAGFARLLRALAISAGVFIVLTCLIALAGSVMDS